MLFLGQTITMCASRNQRVTADSYGYIESQNYPARAASTGDSCSVTLEVQHLSTVVFTIDGRFDMLTYGNQSERDQCYYSTAYFWIGPRSIPNSVCGNLDNGTVIRKVPSPGMSEINIGFVYNPTRYNKHSSFFRVRYSGMLQ